MEGPFRVARKAERAGGIHHRVLDAVVEDAFAQGGGGIVGQGDLDGGGLGVTGPDAVAGDGGEGGGPGVVGGHAVVGDEDGIEVGAEGVEGAAGGVTDQGIAGEDDAAEGIAGVGERAVA